METLSILFDIKKRNPYEYIDKWEQFSKTKVQKKKKKKEFYSNVSMEIIRFWIQTRKNSLNRL